MKKVLFFSGVALLFAAACNKAEVTVNTPTDSLVTFTIAQPDQTKTDLYGVASINWAEGDAILLNCNYTYEVFTLREGAGTKVGVFGNSEGKVYSNELDTYSTSAYYPETVNPRWMDGEQGSGWYITAPAEYVWKEQGLKAPMMTYLSTPHPEWQNFKAITGVLKVDISGIPATADRLVFTAPGKQVSGDFLVDSNAMKISALDAETGNTITITFPAGEATFRSFCIPVPEGTYDGFKLQFYAGDTPIDGTGRTSSVTLAARDIVYLKPYSCDETTPERVIWQGPKFLGDSWDYSIGDIKGPFMTGINPVEGQTLTLYCTASSYDEGEWTYRCAIICKCDPWGALTDGNKELAIGKGPGVKFTLTTTLTANDVADIKAAGFAVTGTRLIVDKITLK